MRLLCSLALLLPVGGVRAQEAPDDPSTVVVIVVGDPGPELVAAAQELEGVVSHCPTLRLPSDPALRGALIGEAAPETADGLSQARELRRLLGWDDARDDQILARISRVVDARAALVLRAEGGAMHLEVFSAQAGRFFDRRLALNEASPETVTRFIQLRLQPPPTLDEEPSPTPAAALVSAEPAAAAPRTPWLRQNWAYLVGGILLAGVVSYAVWSRQDQPPAPQLMLRIVPQEAP